MRQSEIGCLRREFGGGGNFRNILAFSKHAEVFLEACCCFPTPTLDDELGTTEYLPQIRTSVEPNQYVNPPVCTNTKLDVSD